jgi:uncharacterized membrane protein YedE/YeeE
METILQPWPWYFSGPLIALVLLLLVYFGKSFGMSSNLRTFCTMAGASKYSQFFLFEWRTQKWNLMLVLGSVIGGFVASHFLSDGAPIALSANTVKDLEQMHFMNAGQQLMPPELYAWDAVTSLKGISILLVGGFLVGFGTRYAGGCTSGHAITGLSNLQWPSLIAVIGFFIGGLLMTHFILPLLF